MHKGQEDLEGFLIVLIGCLLFTALWAAFWGGGEFAQGSAVAFLVATLAFLFGVFFRR